MKRFLKYLILKIGALVMRDDGPKIVFYHDVGNAYTHMGTDEKIFWEHMQCLRNGDQVCFDDGFRGIWDARERFRELKLCPTVFIAVRLVGQPGYLNWDEILVLQNKFGFNFQSHTWSHQTLAGPMIDESPKAERTDAWFEHELQGSREELGKLLGKEVTELCFPVGYFTDGVVERCKRAGYQRVYASYPARFSRNDFVLPRCLVQFLSVAEFKLVLHGGMNILSRRYKGMHYGT